ncbi:CcoQ/FixQ family Cbb3-type cytochrome c oxidase assembly chaperone [Flavobacterium galactosidilyticum]|uniref:CcoQ/FixQ family Cbb3-type cytochrome c oxidase assembly chaperone n=1 Tax=Flavobacterium galactosidilyticum TaxID=2893886 RepID=UPI001E441B86|nr:CcoQ/FixQ family Cbb3-type cytochrome c oxidase assembly chaperone [Flavobacterium sp. F-340]UFH45060.1 CcoQ/FixQ family Cbb3-type cytochrome c oxidase assembly chaperone [Flavobacterium sp. F-340]
MFEQVKHNLETIDGVATFPIISLLIFFFFFVGLGIWVFSYKKERIDELSQMPLQDNKIV